MTLVSAFDPPSNGLNSDDSRKLGNDLSGVNGNDCAKQRGVNFPVMSMSRLPG
jgi:hypothetical protein